MTVFGQENGLEDQIFVLVTGANSGLGFSICTRLVDDFLRSHPKQQSLTILFTTRSTKKGNDTLRRLQAHLRLATNTTHPAADDAKNRVTFIPENVDLSDLLSVRALSRRLLSTIPKLDAIVLNAGIGGWTGINWPQAIWGVLTDLVHQVSWPSYKIAPAGMITEPQTNTGEEEKDKGDHEEEPRLGAIFCANVFGHYMLSHNVVPLLKRSGAPSGPGRIIWVSSLEATIKFFDAEDIQGLRTAAPYESSKALTDILALTSNLPSAAPWVNSFYSTHASDSASASASTNANGNDHDDDDVKSKPEAKVNMYLTHPGICGTAILPLSLPLFYAMIGAFLFARLLGSPWHTVSTYMGACAPVWLALSRQPDLDAAEAPYRAHGGGRAKWGSSCTRLLGGADSPASTEVDGWGYGGVAGEAVVEQDKGRRRKRGAEDLSGEEKERFEELGRECWMKMEELRVEWDGILDRAEAKAKLKN